MYSALLDYYLRDNHNLLELYLRFYHKFHEMNNEFSIRYILDEHKR